MQVHATRRGGLRAPRAAAITAAAIVAMIMVAGCAPADNDDTAQAPKDPTTSPGTSAASTPSSSKTPNPKTPSPAADVELAIAIEGRDITPAPARVKVPEGGTVRLTVTSDVDNELHVHGVELYKDLPAGKPTTITFKADQSGLFEIETHEEPVLLLTQLQVQ